MRPTPASRTGGELVDDWDRQRQAEPGKSRIILTHTNAEVQSLNGEARDRLWATGYLGDDVAVKTERWTRQFATGDRIMFLRNERGMGVKNGTLERLSAYRPRAWRCASMTGTGYGARQLNSHVASARKGDAQNRWLAW